MNVLLIGGTGIIGRPLVPLLLDLGLSLRVLSRSSERLRALPEGAIGVRGDLDGADSLHRALAGVDTLVLITPHTIAETGQGLAAVHAAFAAGVRRIVFASAVMPAGGARVPRIASKLPIESALMLSRVDYTIVRINDLFQNDLPYEECITGGIYPRPIGRIGVSRVDAEDAARVMAAAVAAEGGRSIVSCSGPEVLMGESVAAAWSRHLGRDVLYAGDDLGRWERNAGADMVRWRRDDDRALYRYMQESGFVADPRQRIDLERMIGRPLRTFDEFAAETVQAWRVATTPDAVAAAAPAWC